MSGPWIYFKYWIMDWLYGGAQIHIYFFYHWSLKVLQKNNPMGAKKQFLHIDFKMADKRTVTRKAVHSKSFYSPTPTMLTYTTCIMWREQRLVTITICDKAPSKMFIGLKPLPLEKFTCNSQVSTRSGICSPFLIPNIQN